MATVPSPRTWLRAIEVARSCFDFDTALLSKADILSMVGVDGSLCERMDIQIVFRSRLEAATYHRGRQDYRMDDASLYRRAAIIYYLSDHFVGEKKSFMAALKLAGFKDDKTNGTYHSKNVGFRRLRTRLGEESANVSKTVDAFILENSGSSWFASSREGKSVQETPAMQVAIPSDVAENNLVEIVSPMSGATGSTRPSLSSQDESTSDHEYRCPLATHSTELDEALALALASGSHDDSSSVASSLSGPRMRRRSAQAHEQRKIDRYYEVLRELAFRVGTLTYDTMRHVPNAPKNLESAESIADRVNKFFGFELVSGRQLQVAARQGNVPQGGIPPPRGRPSELGEETFSEICDLVWSAAAIEQMNADPQRLNRPQQITTVAVIVNQFLKDRGKPEIDDHAFFERVQKRNALKVNYAEVDERESIRLRWLTFRNVLKGYENWERHCVELGFARCATAEEKEEVGHNIIFTDEQRRRILQFDEVGISYNGADWAKGGRPAMTPTYADVNEPGKPASKSSGGCTAMIGMTYEGELLPLFIIFRSDAKAPHLPEKLVATCPQTKARYGHDEPRCFDVILAYNKKGGMNKEMFLEWIKLGLMKYFPNASDTPANRVMMKADSGPGRSDDDFLFQCFVSGFIFYPSLPNGTSLLQEMDQLFALFKMLVYENFEVLTKARAAADSNHKSVAIKDADVLACMYGKTIQFEDGSSIELKNAVEIAFAPEKLERARCKCGFAPANRAALASSKLLRTIDESEEEVDPYIQLCNEVEQTNHKVVEALRSKGFAVANMLKRKIKRITSAQREGRQAALVFEDDNDRYDRLAESSKTAGKHFVLTDGGGPLNHTDVLMGKARIEARKAAKLMAKKKKLIIAWKAIKTKAMLLLDEDDDDTNWTVPELKLLIKYKRGPFPVENEKVPTRAAALKKMWREKYSEKEPPVAIWTRGNEKELNRLCKGEIASIEKSPPYLRAARTLDISLETQVMTLPPSRRKQLLRNILSNLPEGELSGESDDNDSIVEGDDEEHIDEEDGDNSEEDSIDHVENDSDEESITMQQEEANNGEQSFHSDNLNDDEDSDASDDDDETNDDSDTSDNTDDSRGNSIDNREIGDGKAIINNSKEDRDHLEQAPADGEAIEVAEVSDDEGDDKKMEAQTNSVRPRRNAASGQKNYKS